MQQITLACGNSILVDDGDVSLVERYKWRLREGSGKNKSYVTRGGRNADGKLSTIYLHREIMAALPGDVVDHINGDTLDMRRCNLRTTTDAGNAINQRKKSRNNKGLAVSSRFKGVSIDRRSQKRPWQVKIRIPGSHRKHLGCFASEIEAAFAYDMASLDVHGDIGRRNFLPLVQ